MVSLSLTSVLTDWLSSRGYCGEAGSDAGRISLKDIGGADNELMQAHIKADHHKPSGPDADRSSATSLRSVILRSAE
jgi:hypothetical protein